MEFDFIFIILIIVLAVALILAVSSLRNWLFPCVLVMRGAAEADPVCAETSALIDTFLNGRFTADVAASMERLISDIAYDIEDLDERKVKTMKESALDTAAAKLLLDSMLHYYIYDKAPNEQSREYISGNVKKLEMLSKGSLCFTRERVSAVIKYLNEGVRSGRKDESRAQMSSRECFRKVQVMTLGSETSERKKLSDEVDRLKDELTKKNVELRKRDEDLERERAKSRSAYGLGTSSLGTSSLGADLLLDECNRERRQLQEKVYELRRDIDRVRGPAVVASDTELKALRDRVEDLRARNVQLEGQIRDAERNQTGEAARISSMSAELDNCRKLLDEVLNAK